MVDLSRDVDRGSISQYVRQILAEITAELDVGEITPETRIADLCPESINLVYLLAELQQHYRLQDLLVQRLRAAQVRVTDLRMVDLVDLVYSTLAEASSDVRGGRL